MAAAPRSLGMLSGCPKAALSALRGSRLTPNSNPSLHVYPVSSCRCGPPNPPRSYATLKSRVSRSQKSPKSPRSPGLTPKTRLKPQAWADLQKPAVLTPEHIIACNMEAVIKAAGFRHQPHQYIDCTQKFSTIADRGDHTWPYLLDQEERPSPQLMHETGCLLSILKMADPTGVTAVALWAGASELGHTPSTITLRLNFRHGRAQQLAHPLLRPVETRFRALVAAAHPHAVAVQGMLLADEGQTAAAIRTIERALALDPDEALEVWRTGCHGVLGEAYAKVGQTDAARQYLSRAMDQRLGQYGESLAKLVEDENEAWGYKYQAACAKPSLFLHLAEDELRRAEKLTSKDERDMAVKMASEWSRLADPNAKW